MKESDVCPIKDSCKPAVVTEVLRKDTGKIDRIVDKCQFLSSNELCVSGVIFELGPR